MDTTTTRATSQTHPIYVSWLPSQFSGRVGMTFAPGKKSKSKWSNTQWDRDVDQDLERLQKEYDVDVLVNLLEEHEFKRYQIPHLISRAEAMGLQVRRLPIPDGGVLPDATSVVTLIAEITEHVQAGRNVVIHCAGGLGRTGTIGGCWLVSQGMSADEAIETLHRVRSPHCPETRGQERFIREFAQLDLTAKEAKDISAVHEKPDLPARLAGAVLGAAIGDAMGHPTEFLSMDAIIAKYGPKGVQGFVLFRDVDGQRVAPYTDDTQMAEVVLRSLIDARENNLDLDATMQKMAQGFVDWSKHPQGGHRAPGRACLSGCRALDEGVHWSQAGAAKAGGCGSVMRAYPFGLIFHDDENKAELWAVEHSKLTHGDPIALAACAAMAVGMVHALNVDSADEIANKMIAAARRYSVKTAEMMQRAVDEAQDGVKPDVSLDRLRGWAAHEAIAAAVYVFVRHPDDPNAAILEAANTPGDSDSIATLAGALLGARCGLPAMEKNWVEQVERSAVFRDLAERVTAFFVPSQVL